MPVQLVKTSSDKSVGYSELASTTLNCRACCSVSRLNLALSAAEYNLRMGSTFGKRISWLVAAKCTERVEVVLVIFAFTIMMFSECFVSLKNRDATCALLILK